ncbi:Gfo/Idh/MocA family oxidoreductase [Chelativorans sp.]|uniref:Gfo/Idh/MocA family protein n=1 Tax=Chelativorans sp. TaxID=2203393 RepID=UPI0028117E14|nr:Gfo/Idh/MocA family oxidoreductase [Chelativorans sp.]
MVGVRAALIGVAGFGRVHCADLLRLSERGEARIAAATIRDEARAPEHAAALRGAGARIFSDYREMLAALKGEIDLCFIPTGIHLHEKMTVDALEAGANVFVEKPAAATIGQVERMRAAEATAGRFVAVGYQTMYAPETLTMKRAILDGTIGALEAVKCRGLWPRPDTYYEKPWIGRIREGNIWILDSPFNNAFAHQLNMVAFLAGRELARTAELAAIEAELYSARDIETADTAAMRIRTRDDAPLYFLVSHCPEGVLNPEIVVRGSRGRIHWTPERLLIERDGAVVTEMECLTGTDLRDTMLRAVLKRIAEPQHFVCTLEVAAAETLAANGAHLSSPVHPVPKDIVRRVPQDSSMRTVIAGLDELIARAFTEEKLPSELCVPWAAPGKKVALDQAAIAAAYPETEESP